MGDRRRWTPDVVRQRIRTTMIVRRLIEHVNGENEMTATQVRAAEILLKKALPDLSAVEYTNRRDERPIEEWTDAELSAALADLRARRAALDGGPDPQPGAPEPGPVH